MNNFNNQEKVLKEKIKNLQNENFSLQESKKKLLFKNKQLKKDIYKQKGEVFRLKKELEQTREKPLEKEHSSQEDNILQRIESSVSQLSKSHLGQWNQISNKMTDLQSEFYKLKKKINLTQIPQRKILKKIPLREIRVGLFVDVQNIFYGARNFNAKLDFDQLLENFVNKRRLIRAFAYVVQTSEVDQSGFLTMLQHKNFEVKSKVLRLRSDGSAKANWDIEMTIDMLSLVDQFDVIVLVSGDGDFVPLVNILKTLGPYIEVCSFPHNTSRDLIEAADQYFPIDESLLILDEYQDLNTKPIKRNHQENDYINKKTNAAG